MEGQMCGCIEKVNEQLKPDGLYLETISMLNFATGKARETTFCNTQRLQRGKGKKKKVVPTFCPFCGDRLKPAA
jgi:hypothetical protein